MAHPLDNILWNCLDGPHRHLSTGTDRARRYAPGLSPIVGFPDPLRPDFAALRPFCAPGEQLYCDIWSGPAPNGWRIELEAAMFRLAWDGRPGPAAGPIADAVALGPEHVEQALALTRLTRPGPFGPRTIELGDYFGCFEDGRLVAMAGERMTAGGYREISSVCTHPDQRGRGFATRLMQKLVMRQLARGETPFLHATSANRRARELYLRMGFRDFRETVVRIVTPC